jgi:threonine dehydrogenase-like Zn-dependent dehydrogenase
VSESRCSPGKMKALIIKKPGEAVVGTIPEPVDSHESLLLKVRMIGLCGSDLNSFRGRNPLVTFPRIPGHEVAATIVVGSKENPALAAGVDVTMSPYTSCGKCATVRMPANLMKHWACRGMEP